MGTAAIVGGALVGGVANIVAGDKAAKEAARARAQAGDQQAQAMLQMREAVERLEAEGVPSVEAQRIVLEQPELVGLQDIHQLATSKLEDIEVDPRLRDAQMGALEQIQQFGGAGLTDSEKAQALLMQREAAGEEQARQKRILQSMAERGAGGSGAELAARLSSSQSAAERRALAQAQLAGQAQQRALQAIAQGGQLAGQIRSQEYGEQSEAARAADAIARFNLQQRSQVEAANLARRQAIADEQTRLANLQEQYNKELLGKQYQQRMDKAKSIASAKTGTAQQQMTQADQTLKAGQAAAEGQLQQGAAIGDIAVGVGSNLAKYEASSDDNEKLSTAGGSYDSNVYAADGGVMPMTLQPRQINPMSPPIQSPSPTGYEEGGIPKYAGGDIALEVEDAEIIPGDDYAGDRVDAKINSGEMVLNVEQQQRLMDLLKGYRDLQGLGDENIIEQPPISSPEVELPEDLPSIPPPTVPEEIPQAAAHGGVVKEEDLGHRLLKEHDKMKSQSDELDDAQKNTKARIKALETLMGKK